MRVFKSIVPNLIFDCNYRQEQGGVKLDEGDLVIMQNQTVGVVHNGKFYETINYAVVVFDYLAAKKIQELEDGTNV